jgi:cytochrome c-type biogenesis protein
MDHYGESGSSKVNKIILSHSIVFVLGFSFVFVLLGASSSMVGHFMSTYQAYIMKIGGMLLIVMGLFSLNIIKIPFLNQEKVIHMKEKPLGFFGSFMVGVTFSLGWTPCIGPALSSILIIASTQESIARGVYLLSMYSLGLAVPFIISALLFHRLLGLLKRYGFVVKYTAKIMGILLIVVGLLLVTSYFNRFAQWVEQLF